MPISRKLIKLGGNSKGLIIPAGWLRHLEEETGEPVTELLMEIDTVITLAPKKPNSGAGKGG